MGSLQTGTHRPLPTFYRSIPCDELDHFFEIWITGTKAPREPASAALGYFFTINEHIELASFARRTNSFDI